MDKANVILINRLEILKFFDCPDGGTRDANSIVAVIGEELGAGLLKHYLERFECATVQVLSDACTPGTRSGQRLDRWVHAQWTDRETLFQVEIKNWSSNSLGIKRLNIDASPDDVAAYKVRQWALRWDYLMRDGKDEAGLRKVLIPMKSERPRIVEPLLCLWEPIHPQGRVAPMFSVELTQSHFNRLWFFSMSSYLRTLDDTLLSLEMPDTVRRLATLERLLPSLEVDNAGQVI